MEKKLDIEKYRKLLVKEKERLEFEHRIVNSDISDRVEDLSDYDDHHPADAATDTFDRSKDFAIDENYKDIIEQINDALRKIDGGTYGMCDRCGTPINPDRLRAIPYATLCIKCQEIIERR